MLYQVGLLGTSL